MNHGFSPISTDLLLLSPSVEIREDPRLISFFALLQDK